MKSRNHWMGVCALATLAFLSTCSIAAAESSPEEVLKSKGLSRVGQKYLLESDAGLAGWLRQVRASERKVDEAVKRRSNLERDIRGLEATGNELYANWFKEKQTLGAMSKNAIANYNLQVDYVNGFRARILATLDVIKQRTAVLQTIGDPSDEYVAIILKFGTAIDSTMEKYKSLADDPDVKNALDKVNKSSLAKFTLGPSDRLANELPDIRKLRDRVNSDTINFEFQGGVPTVPITLNGKLAISAIVDSGAAAVSISDKVARELGLVPGPDDHIIHMVTADGSVDEVHLMIIKSIRLGKFTIENVECVVQRANGRDIDTLLGGTFLRRFVYKMDLSARQLKLSQIADQTIGDVVASPKPPTTRPAVATAPPAGPGSGPPVERKTSGCVITGTNFTRAPLSNGGKAFADRTYIWQGLPAMFQGGWYTRILAGGHPVIKVRAERDTTIYAAVPSRQSGIDLTGWTRAQDLSFTYSDDHQSQLDVYEKQLATGEKIELPQGNWSGIGMILLVPPTPQK
jgi:clan AA aspartic protease (TIGR02281 family)